MPQIFDERQIGRVQFAHRRLLANTTTAIAQATVRAGQHALEHVKRYPTFKPRTGALQQATEWRTIRTGDGRILRIQNRKKYAGPIDQGARPHIIRARRRKVLRFVTSGGLIFRRSVRHPGNRPYKFLYRATVSAGRVLADDLGARMKRLAASF